MSGTSVNTRVITNLINAGAINLGYNRRTLIENLDNVLNYADIAKDSGMIEVEKPYILEYDEYSKKDIMDNELKTIGFYLTEHPTSKYREESSISSLNINNYFDKNINIIVLIKKIRETTTKNNDVMAFITGEDEFGEIPLTIFPTTYKRFNNIEEGNIIKVFGRVERRFDKYQVIVNNIQIIE